MRNPYVLAEEKGKEKEKWKNLFGFFTNFSQSNI